MNLDNYFREMEGGWLCQVDFGYDHNLGKSCEIIIFGSLLTTLILLK